MAEVLKQDMYLTIRFPRELWRNHLKELEYGTMSKFCRDAIIEKIHKEFSTEYANQQIQYFMDQVKIWKQKKKDLTASPEQIKEILRGGLKQFGYFEQEGDLLNFKKYLQSTILHRLQKIGCGLGLEEIIEIYEEGVEKYGK